MFHSSNLGVALLVMVVMVLPLGGNGQEASFFAKNPSTLFPNNQLGTPFINVSKNVGGAYIKELGKNFSLTLAG